MAREVLFYQCLRVTKLYAKFGCSRTPRTASIPKSFIVLRCMWKEPAPLAIPFPKSIFWADELKLLVSSYEGANEAPFLCWKYWPVRLQLAARDENVQFWPKIWIFGAKSQYFCFGIATFVNSANHQYTWGYNFPIGTTPKKNSVSELGVIFWGSPLFLAVLG